jgi:hypothetical protein
MEMDPIGRAHRHIPVQPIFVSVLNDMQMLYAKAFARAHHRAGVMWLKDILKDHPDMICPVFNDVGHPGFLFRSDEL